MFIVLSQTATHRPEGGAPTKSVQPPCGSGAPTKSVQPPCGSGAPAAMSDLHTTPHRSVPLRCTR